MGKRMGAFEVSMKHPFDGVMAQLVGTLGNFSHGGLGAAIASATADRVVASLRSAPTTPVPAVQSAAKAEDRSHDFDNAAFLQVLKTVVSRDRYVTLVTCQA